MANVIHVRKFVFQLELPIFEVAEPQVFYDDLGCRRLTLAFAARLIQDSSSKQKINPNRYEAQQWLSNYGGSLFEALGLPRITQNQIDTWVEFGCQIPKHSRVIMNI